MPDKLALMDRMEYNGTYYSSVDIEEVESDLLLIHIYPSPQLINLEHRRTVVLTKAFVFNISHYIKPKLLMLGKLH